jgi:hypothetical protein
MIAILVTVLLAALALAFVLYPLLRRGPQVEQSTNAVSEQSEAPAGAEREQAARDGLREVELDFQLGNIAEQDYRTLRERYVQRALVALKSRYDREQELDEMIEEQLRKLKEQEQDAT